MSSASVFAQVAEGYGIAERIYLRNAVIPLLTCRSTQEVGGVRLGDNAAKSFVAVELEITEGQLAHVRQESIIIVLTNQFRPGALFRRVSDDKVIDNRLEKKLP